MLKLYVIKVGYMQYVAWYAERDTTSATKTNLTPTKCLTWKPSKVATSNPRQAVMLLRSRIYLDLFNYKVSFVNSVDGLV